MNYIVTYISDLLAGFLGNSTLLEGSAGLFPTTVSSAGTTTTELGNIVMDQEYADGSKSSFLQTAGTSITATGTAVSFNSDITAQKAMEIQRQRLSSAYIESLNDEELSTLVAKIDNVEIKNDTDKQLIIK